ncbi:unnamed protein product [Mycena citricolor]|uniref:Arrestin-like N-terminal domain-containing protein n=1 Tax=Mycena citricolor TaxID=2018698 RepID=A0AAD2HVI6_9AGAR|nr:unnamed protein product [Mycena citricolor]
MPSNDGPLTLHFHDCTRVAGETIYGLVDIDVRAALEDGINQVCVTLCGTIHARLSVNIARTTVHKEQSIILFYTRLPLLSEDSDTLRFSPGEKTLSSPFQFTFPHDVPPSFHTRGKHHEGTIAYCIEVAGRKAGDVTARRQIRQLISLVPPASITQVAARECLTFPRESEWREYNTTKKVRRGILGSDSEARLKLSIPDLAAYPMSSDIPFVLRVETATEPMRKSGEAPLDKRRKPMFPAPPTESGQVGMHLHRRMEIHVGRQTSAAEDDFELDSRPSADTRVVVDEPQWVAGDRKGRGSWHRAVTFRGSLNLALVPTYSADYLSWKYSLRFVVRFPGKANEVELEVPICIHPSFECPPPPMEIPDPRSVDPKSHGNLELPAYVSHALRLAHPPTDSSHTGPIGRTTAVASGTLKITDEHTFLTSEDMIYTMTQGVARPGHLVIDISHDLITR